MSTKNPRINITCEAEIAQLLAALAQEEKKTLSKIALELIEDSLERREDMEFSTMAEIREAKTKKLISHNDAWK